MNNILPKTDGKIKFKLQNKIILLVIGVLFIGMTLITYFSYSMGYRARKRIAEGDMRRVAALIATVHTLDEHPDWKRTDVYVKTIMSLYANGGGAEHLELFYIVVLDKNEIPNASAMNFDLSRRIGIKLSGPTGEPLDEKQLSEAGATVQWDKQVIPGIDKIIMPMMVNGKKFGTIKVGYYVKQFAVLERGNLIINALLLILLCIIGTVVAVIITQRVVRPILDTVKAMTLLAGGDLEYRLPVHGEDETRLLAEYFNDMSDTLKKSKIELGKKEKDLALSESKYRSLFHGAGDGILFLDADGRCLDANGEAERMFGWPAGMLKGARLLDLVIPNCREKELEDFSSLWEGKVGVPGGNACEVEVRMANLADGCKIAVLRDVNHWRESEEKIRRIKLKQQKLIESLPLGIFTADHGLNITEMNRFMKNLFDIDGGSKDGKSVSFISGCLEKCNLEQAMRVALNDGREVRISDVPARLPNGIFKSLDFRILRFVGEPGMPASLLVVVNDVTDRLEMESIRKDFEKRMAQAQKLQAIGTLAGGIAHDFNNMLAVIMGNASLALCDILNDNPAHEALKDILHASERAKELTTKLQTFAGKEKISVEKIRTDKFFDNVICHLKRNLPPEINLKTDFQENLIVNLDPNFMRQAILNICTNAIEAMPHGGILTLECRESFNDESAAARNSVQSRGFCLVRINDTGVGIPDNIIGRVFEPFFTTKGIGESAGLGLSIAVGIVKSHNGSIKIKSKPGDGTEVKVRLPLAPEDVEENFENTSAGLAAGDKNVLIVGDNRDFLDMMADLLSEEGYVAAVVVGGGKAVDLYESCAEEIAVVISEANMSAMKAGDLFLALKKINPGVKMILCSESDLEGEPAIQMASGIQGFIQIPFEPVVLRRIIQEVLAG